MTESGPDIVPAPREHDRMLALTTQIVAAHIGKNAVPGTELLVLIGQVFQTVTGLDVTLPIIAAARPGPAVPVKKSVFADYIVCLEDGKKLRMLKRHLMKFYGMTPDAYRERWDLPPNYPMVAPSYSEKRFSLAKAIGLGSKRARTAVGE